MGKEIRIGASVSAVATAGGEVNLVPNPRCHVNVTDGWAYFYDSGLTPVPTRVTNPPVALPAGSDACACFRWPYVGTCGIMHTERQPIPEGWQNLEAFYSVWCNNPDALLYPPNLVFFDANNAEIYYISYDDDTAAAGSSFHELHTTCPVPSAATQFALYTDGFAQAGNYYFATAFRICEADVVTSEYADGDSAGWAWDGPAHNSASRSASVATPPAFAVSRDSAGILIGVRDNAAPQFAVSRDAEGLTISATRGPA